MHMVETEDSAAKRKLAAVLAELEGTASDDCLTHLCLNPGGIYNTPHLQKQYDYFLESERRRHMFTVPTLTGHTL